MKVRAFAQASHSAAARLLVTLPLADGLLQARGKHGTNRCIFFSRQDARLPQEISFDLQSHIGLHRHNYSAAHYCVPKPSRPGLKWVPIISEVLAIVNDPKKLSLKLDEIDNREQAAKWSINPLGVG